MTRRSNEKVVIINDDIHIAVLDIRGNQVRLGIKAPKDIPVHRQEIYEKIKKESQKDDA